MRVACDVDKATYAKTQPCADCRKSNNPAQADGSAPDGKARSPKNRERNDTTGHPHASATEDVPELLQERLLSDSEMKCQVKSPRDVSGRFKMYHLGSIQSVPPRRGLFSWFWSCFSSFSRLVFQRTREDRALQECNSSALVSKDCPGIRLPVFLQTKAGSFFHLSASLGPSR